jgi:hypothetical protein
MATLTSLPYLPQWKKVNNRMAMLLVEDEWPETACDRPFLSNGGPMWFMCSDWFMEQI